MEDASGPPPDVVAPPEPVVTTPKPEPTTPPADTSVDAHTPTPDASVDAQLVSAEAQPDSTDDTAEANTGLQSPEVQLEVRARELAVAGTIVIANTTTEVRDRLRALPDRAAQEAFRAANPAQDALFMNRLVRTMKDGEFTGKGIVLTDTDGKPKYTVDIGDEATSETRGIIRITKSAGGILTCEVDGQDDPLEIPQGMLASIMMQTDSELILSNFEGKEQELVKRSIEQQKDPTGALTAELEEGLDELVLEVAKNNGILTMDNLRGFVNHTVPEADRAAVLARLDALGGNLANPDAFNVVLEGAGITVAGMEQQVTDARARQTELTRLMGHKAGEVVTIDGKQHRISNDDHELWQQAFLQEALTIELNTRIIEASQAGGGLIEQFNTRQIEGLVPPDQARALAQYVETGNTEQMLTVLVPEVPEDATDAQKKAMKDKRDQYDKYLKSFGVGAGVFALLIALGLVSGSK